MLRTLTEREREVLAAMITHAKAHEEDVTAERRRQWLAEVPGTRVSSVCTCGTCPSIELVDLDGHAPDTESERTILSAGLLGATALVMLFIDGDQPSYLELPPFPEHEFAEFPPASELSFTG